MRKLCSLTIAIAIGFIISLPALTTQEDAKAIVLDQILVNDLGKANVYLTNQTIVSGTDMAAGAYILNTPYSSNWVAFIDDNPTFGWTHPCRYVFVDESTGSYQISQAMIYPENMSIFERIAEYTYPSMSEIELPQSQETITYRDRDPHLYAIIINGSNSSNKSIRFWKTCPQCILL